MNNRGKKKGGFSNAIIFRLKKSKNQKLVCIRNLENEREREIFIDTIGVLIIQKMPLFYTQTITNQDKIYFLYIINKIVVIGITGQPF